MVMLHVRRECSRRALRNKGVPSARPEYVLTFA